MTLVPSPQLCPDSYEPVTAHFPGTSKYVKSNFGGFKKANSIIIWGIRDGTSPEDLQTFGGYKLCQRLSAINYHTIAS